jgi:hypothetical protein
MAKRRAVTKQMARRYAGFSKTNGARSSMSSARSRVVPSPRIRALAQVIDPPKRSGRPPRPARTAGRSWDRSESCGHAERARLQAPGTVHGRIVSALERSGELELPARSQTNCCGFTAGTIDRLLAPERARLRVKGRSGTKRRRILKRQMDPDLRRVERDSSRVLRDGPGGPRRRRWIRRSCQTLDLTCVATGWTECPAVKNKAQRWCFEVLLDIEASLPFPLLGLDSDNRSEFINDQLYRCCTDTAPSEVLPSPGHGPIARTTTASSSRRTGRWSAKTLATPATTHRQSSKS